jgi:hypothetical protein
VLEHHPDRPLKYLRQELVRSSHSLILSNNGASGNPGAVHFHITHRPRPLGANCLRTQPS